MNKYALRIFIFILLFLNINIKANAEIFYNSNDLTQKSNATINEIYNMLENTNYHYSDVAEAIKKAEDDYNVNAVFIIAMTKLESGNGTNQLTDIYNITSMKNIKGNWKEFNSFMHCIDYTSKWLEKSYLNEAGCYFKGKSIYDVNTYYCEEKHWSNSINNIAYSLLDKVN